jgi:hypothetical protein
VVLSVHSARLPDPVHAPGNADEEAGWSKASEITASPAHTQTASIGHRESERTSMNVIAAPEPRLAFAPSLNSNGCPGVTDVGSVGLEQPARLNSSSTNVLDRDAISTIVSPNRVALLAAGADNDSRATMDEHDDDLEPEVEEGVEVEAEDFPGAREEDEGAEGEGALSPQLDVEIDPDKSEI